MHSNIVASDYNLIYFGISKQNSEFIMYSFFFKMANSIKLKIIMNQIAWEKELSRKKNIIENNLVDAQFKWKIMNYNWELLKSIFLDAQNQKPVIAKHDTLKTDNKAKQHVSKQN